MKSRQDSTAYISFVFLVTFYPTALKGVLFSPMVSRWAGGMHREKVCLGCISETVRCRKLIFGTDIG